MVDRAQLLELLAIRERMLLGAREQEQRIRREARELVLHRRAAYDEVFEQVYLSVDCEHCGSGRGVDCVGRPLGGWHTARYAACRMPESVRL